MALEIFERQGQRFVSVQQWPMPEWPGVASTQALPTLTIKEDDLFMITDTLGNISGSLKHDQNTNLGLFCRDSRFLSRLELQIEGCSPILLSSNADKGFAISVLSANPELPNIPAETIGIQRDMVLNGGRVAAGPIRCHRSPISTLPTMWKRWPIIWESTALRWAAKTQVTPT